MLFKTFYEMLVTSQWVSGVGIKNEIAQKFALWFLNSSLQFIEKKNLPLRTVCVQTIKKRFLVLDAKTTCSGFSLKNHLNMILNFSLS